MRNQTTALRGTSIGQKRDVVSTTSAQPQMTIGGDLSVNRIGYGAMKLTGAQVWGPYPDHDHAIRVLRGVVDAGAT